MDYKMPKTGHYFSMTGNQKMIAVLLLLLLHSLQITLAGEPVIEGDFSGLAPDCEEKAKDYIKKAISGLIKASLELRKCQFHFIRQTSTGQMQGWYALPPGFPCAFGATCDYDGHCKCSACP